MDTGQKLTDEELKKLERRIAKEYKTAVKEMEKKLKDYLDETEAGRQVQIQLYRAGKISKDEYESWVYRHTMVGRRWEQMRDTLAADMHKTNEIAKAMSEGQAADVFALNGNYATYQLEHDGKIDTGFTLYNHDTAQYLLEDQRQLMPVPSNAKAREIAANKDMKWNMKKIQSAVLQGVMQGESPYAVAERLEQVGQMNHNSAVRYARTMTTSAQNAGRYEAYRRADKLGVNLSIEWQATLDGRTRHDHRLMHGQRRKVDEPFILPDGQEILFPADCSHNSYELQGEIWNCRCTLLSWVKGFEGDTVKDSPKMDGMSFEEWQNEKAPKPKPQEEKPYSTKEEYEAYKGKMKEKLAEREEQLKRQEEHEKQTILDEKYGGNFAERRIATRMDDTLTDEEKRIRIDQINAQREQYYREVEKLDKKYVELFEKETREHTVYDLDYEFKKMPRLMTAEENARVINPNFSTFAFEYTNNCQRCAMATELRFRGYDVVALGCDSYGGLGAGAHINYAFQTASRFDTGGGREAVKEVIDQMKEWGDGARGIINATYSGGGHCFNVINEKGVIKFVDSQCGSVWGTDIYDVDEIYGSVIERAGHTVLYRTDDARLFGIPDGWVTER